MSSVTRNFINFSFFSRNNLIRKANLARFDSPLVASREIYRYVIKKNLHKNLFFEVKNVFYDILSSIIFLSFSNGNNGYEILK